MQTLRLLVSCLACLAWGCDDPTAGPVTATAPDVAEDFPVFESVGSYPLDPPAPADAYAPELTAGPGGVVLSWLEPTDPDDRGAARLRYARLLDGASGWGEPHTVVDTVGMFGNWADRPEVFAWGDGSLVAHWLGKLGEGTYAYGIQTVRSTDGELWDAPQLLHDDISETEHGFVSWLRHGEALWAFWLDGRAMAKEGPMQLRARRFHGDSNVSSGSPEHLDRWALDDRVCECCDTDAASTADGPIVVYRDRSAAEVRDIRAVRWTGNGWGEPVSVADDGWTIHGCPVNGPAVGAAGNTVAVAWFTMADDMPRVRLAWSVDGGATFGDPLELDDARPLGRVDLAMGPDGVAWVTWLAAGPTKEQARVVVRPIGPSGPLGAVTVLGETAASRKAGVPRLVRQGDRLVAAWIKTGDPAQVRTTMIEP